MGMDVSGLNPTSERGSYFRANLWVWRPIHYLSAKANEVAKLGYDMSNWGYNDGGGLKAKNKCKKLANDLESLIANDERLHKPDDKIYICLGMWCEAGTGKFVGDTEALDEVYPMGTIMYNTIVDVKGRHLEPAHSIDREFLEEWIAFLRECGGFEIY
jgi:hypothetical protein